MKQSIVRLLAVGLILGAVLGSTIPMASAKICDKPMSLCVEKTYIVIEKLHWPPDCIKCGIVDLNDIYSRDPIDQSVVLQVETFAR